MICDCTSGIISVYILWLHNTCDTVSYLYWVLVNNNLLRGAFHLIVKFESVVCRWVGLCVCVCEREREREVSHDFLKGFICVMCSIKFFFFLSLFCFRFFNQFLW